MAEPVKFTVGGAVQAQAGTYLARPADEELFKACQNGEFAYILACRQIGKSSLMFETDKRLRQVGIRTAVIDLSSIGQRNISADSWYFSLIDELANNLNLQVNVQTWWETKPPLSTPVQRFLQFLRDVVLREIETESIVVFVDEIDTTLELEFTDDFFVAIRSVYNDRARYPVYHRLTFVLLGMATPSELIRDNSRTPFNIGRAIALRDFTLAECAPFREAIGSKYPDDSYFEQVYDWTHGHPYLTQKLGKAVLDWPGDDNSNLIDTLVAQLFLNPEGPGDDNLQFVQKSVTHNYPAREMLRLYKRVLQNEEPIPDDEKSIATNRLKLYGLVEVRNGTLQVRNKLYAQAFNLNWVEEMLEKNTYQQLGIPARYRIVQEIARGGFATIYLAETTPLEGGEIRNVALKVLDPREENAADPVKLIKRFEREATVVARLNHLNLMPIYETGRSETGREAEPALFIAMKYIPGGTLARRIKSEGALRRDEAVSIIKQIGSALAYAHNQGIIHRDVKPTNILLDTDYDPPRPILTDFGLVKEMAIREETFTTKPPGTSRYMAPEQLAPERWKEYAFSPATDIYALAITFFEMVAGEHPFEADSDHKLSSPEFINKHLSEPLPKLGDVAPQVGSLFDEILAQATAKDPAERFTGVLEFVEALAAANDEANRNRAARLVRAAKDFAQDQNPDEALTMIEKALQIYPMDIEALRLRGKIKNDQGLLQEALIDYRQAYEQENKLTSAAGLDYLGILQRLARDAWHDGMVDETLGYYQTIVHLMNEGRAKGIDIGIWDEAWAALVKSHYAVGQETYRQGNIDNLVEISDMLKREIRALQGLLAEQESQDLQEKLRLLQVETHHALGNRTYGDGKPKNMLEAIQSLKWKIRILNQLNASQESQDLQNKQRLLRVKCHHATGEQAYEAGQADDIRAAVRPLKRKIWVLKRLGAEPEQQDLQEKLKLCHLRIGEQAYANGNPTDLQQALTILDRESEALSALGAESAYQDLQVKRRLLQIKNHYQIGEQAYAGGKPEQLDPAIEILEREIQALDELGAQAESQQLRDKLRQLQIKRYEHSIETAVAEIDRFKAQVPIDEKAIFQRYDKIDQAYATLLDFSSENELWQNSRRQKLKERAEYRQELARRAEQIHDYETALQHYQNILNIEQIKKYESLAQELNLDLIKKIGDLKVKVDHNRKYREIEKLLDKGDYLPALDRLIEDFISKGVYEHRDVAQLLWQLIYAKQHEGKLPPELTSAAELTTVRNQLTQSDQTLEQLRSEITLLQQKLTQAEKKLNQVETRAATTRSRLANTEQTLNQIRSEANTIRAKLAETEQALSQTQIEATTAQSKLTETEQNLTESQAELSRLKSQLDEAKQIPEKLRKQHGLNKIVIPISLILAAIGGGIVGPQLQAIPGLRVVTILIWILLFGYFGYYLWIYYISPPFQE